jgi:hypothetical protein
MFDVVERESGTITGKQKYQKETDILDEHYLCQPSAVKHNENQQDLYNRTIEKHGIKMKSYVAVQKTASANLPYLEKK